MIQRVFKDSILYTFANHAPLLVNIFILPIITPFLSPEDYAIYGLALAYTGALAALGHLGFIPLFQNAFFHSPNEYPSLWSKYFGVLLIWRFFFGLMVLTVLYFAFRHKLVSMDLYLLLFLVATPLIVFELPKYLGLLLCQYEGKHSYVYIITFITSLLSIAITFMGVYVYRWGYKAWLLSSFTVALVQFFYFTWYLTFRKGIKPSWKFDVSFVRDCVKKSVPVIPHYYSAYILETSDRLWLDIYKVKLSDIGQYNIAYSFSNYFKSFQDAMNTVISPLIFKMLGQKEEMIHEKIKNLTMLWFYFTLFATFFLSLWVKNIFEFLYQNKELQTGYYLAIFILISFSYRPFYVASVDRAIFFGKASSIYKISVGAGVMSLLLNLFLIPYFGVHAAVFTTFMSYLYMGFSGFFLKDIRVYIAETYPVVYIILLMIVFSIISFMLKDIFWLYKVGLSILGASAGLIFWFKKAKPMYEELKKVPTLHTNGC